MTENTRKHLQHLLKSEMQGQENRIEEVQKWLNYHRKYDYDKCLDLFGETFEEYEAEQMERIARYTTRLAELKKMYAEI